ncbi:MAG: hypothetical protein MUE81_07225 [Thermoflexibacter sp.]|nr:hypothetical protein [Thermoflexibacter sp.]
MNQYKLKYFSVFTLIIFSVALSSCYKENQWDWVGQNTTLTGKGFAPVSTNTLFDFNLTNPNNTSNPRIPRSINATTSARPEILPAGYTLQTELQYYCIDPIKEVMVYQTVGTAARTTLRTVPYQPSFSRVKGLDTLMIEYTVPQLASGTNIILDLDVVSTNGLGLVGSTGATANISSPRRVFIRVR